MNKLESYTKWINSKKMTLSMDTHKQIQMEKNMDSIILYNIRLKNRQNYNILGWIV